MKKLILCIFLLLTFCPILWSQACAPHGNEVSFGSNNTWIGYVYDNQNFTNYRGYSNEGNAGSPNFDESFGGDNVSYPTNGCSLQTETFSVRYKLTKTFANATYDFTVGGDDGFRLSLDGGTTWVINNWNDQSYTTTTYTVALNGTYNMVLEYYENGGGNRVSFTVVTACSDAENTNLYGSSNIWNGYIYDGTNFNSYKGMVQQGTAGDLSFDQNFGGSNTSYSTSGCSVQTETFSVRYRLTKTFPNGNYTFIVGGDDGFRLSLDGGATWAINRWSDQSYNTASCSVNLNGTCDLVLEFYENGGENRISLVMQTNIILKINLLSFSGRKDANTVVLDWDISADSDPLSFEIEKSTDGTVFNSMQTIPVGSTTANNRHFTYTDAGSLPNHLFYRLKMTDLQGATSYSHIVAILESAVKPGEVLLFPTIVTNNVIYCKTGKTINNGTIRVTDIHGRLIYRERIGKIEKGQTAGISTGSNKSTSGTYLVTLFDGDEPLLTQKIIM